jgi:phosphatidylglycerophosphate synthase
MSRHPIITPNQITVCRLILVPVLWVFAFMDMPKFIAIGLILTLFLDNLDGFLARKFNLSSELGNRLDRLADRLVEGSVFVWILIFEPSIVTDHLLLAFSLIVLTIASLLVGWIRTRRLFSFHLQSARLAVLVAAIFIAYTFLFGGYTKPLFFVTTATLFVAAIEDLLAKLMVEDPGKPIKYFALAYLKRQRHR